MLPLLARAGTLRTHTHDTHVHTRTYVCTCVQMEDPKPDHDMRPRYKKIEKVLQQAEEMGNK